MRSLNERADGARWRMCILCAGLALVACDAPLEISSDAGAPTALADAGALQDAAACDPRCDECGAPDGCGGTCAPCVEECSCEGRVCGDDGCGGSCGTCGDGASCGGDGARCDCGDATVTYAVRAPGVDWHTTERVEVTLRQRFETEGAPTIYEVAIDRFIPEADVVIEGACAPDVEVRWRYVSRHRDRLGRRLYCEGDEWELTGETRIDLPAGTGGACRAL